MARQNVADRAALLQRGVQRIDRSAGNAEGDGDAFLFQDPYGRIDRSHLRHVAPRCLLDMMITAMTDDLNEAEFVSRDVE